MSTPADATPAPAPELTPEELAHFHSAAALSHATSVAIEDPATQPDTREQTLIPMNEAAWQEQTQLNELALHRDTFDLEKDKQALDPTIQSIQALRNTLAADAEKTNAILTVLSVADAVLATGQQLGLDV